MSFSASATAPASQAVRFPDERTKNQPTLSKSTAERSTDDALHNKIQIAIVAGYVLSQWLLNWWKNRKKDKSDRDDTAASS